MVARATINRMDLDAARAIVSEQHNAVLATVRADGRPQMSPVTVAVDAAGNIVVSSRQTAYKVRNLRRDPHVFLCVLPDAFVGRWVQIEGRATIVDLPEAMEPLIDYYRRAAGEHPDWDDYRAAMERDQRVLIRIEPTRAGPDRSG
jgi:PPOX class probable F420-dependent enzyme